MNNELLYRIALTKVPNIGDVHGKALINTLSNAETVFKTSKKDLEHIDGIGEIRAASIKKFENFEAIEQEILFLEKHNISALFLTDPQYPKRLLNCYDSPLMLYYKGTADLNHAKIVSVIGTRNNSEYGKYCCEKLIEDLSKESIIIVSGLAFGIDTIAHKISLKYNLPTIGVLAHGLDRIYPAQNRSLARQMSESGGLLTDYTSNTKPDRQNFPRRNRIVAGICDALVVMESSANGGSLITAELANGYNKDVFAFPGRANDTKSEGCNDLIKNNKAALITQADDILKLMRWKDPLRKKTARQKELFSELTPDEKKVMDVLQQKNNGAHIDELYVKCQLTNSVLAATLLTMEMKNIIITMPGKIYRILD